MKFKIFTFIFALFFTANLNAQCTGTATLSVTINPAVNAGFTASVSSTTATFTNTSTGATTYSWNFGDGTATVSTTNPSHTYASAGTYTVVLTATNACGSMNYTQVVTIACPAATIAASAAASSICAGGSTILSATAGFGGYQWYNGTTAITGANSSTYTATAAGTYHVIGTNGSCPYTSSNVTITVNPAPTASFTSSVSSLTVNFTETATNETSYSWNWGDGTAVGTTANPSHTYASAGTYTVVLTATNACGSNNYTQVVTVTCPAASIAASAAVTSFCAGGSTTLTATAGFGGYQWYNGTTAITGAMSSTYTATAAGTYHVIGTNGTCPYTSSNVTLTVNPAPTASFTSSVSSLTVNFTETATNETSYSWNWGDGTTVGTTANPSHTYTTAGTYTVVLTATNACGSSNYTQIITVTCPAATIAASTTATSFCAGLSATLSATSGFGSYQWYNGSTAITGATSSTYTATAAGTYHVIGTNGTCPYTSSNVTLTVNPAPTASFTSSVSSLTVNFTETATNETSYSWNWGDGTAVGTTANPSHTYTTAGTYTVVLTATNACGSSNYTQVITVTCPVATIAASAAATSFCAGMSTTLTATSGFSTYQWYNGTTLISGANSSTYTANVAGTYHVIATNGTCPYTSGNVTLTVNPLPIASFTSSVSSFTVNFTETASNETSYSWNWGDGTALGTTANPSHTYASAGVYTVVLTVSNACGTSEFTQVLDLSCPNVSLAATSTSTSFCEGMSQTLNSTTGFDSYQWYLNGNPITSATFQNYNATEAGTYFVTVTQGACNYTSNNIVLGTNPLPISSFNNSVSGFVVNFTETASNETSYTWNFGDGSTSTLANPTHTYTNPGTYTVILVVTNSCGSNTYTQVVNVSCPTASLSASAASTAFCEGTSSMLTATSGFSSYQWYNGSTPIAGATNSTYAATAAGIYHVEAMNGACTYNSSNVTITVNPLPISSFSNSVSGLAVSFTEAATNETSYSWNFGDGGTSTLANPSHTYAAPGTYTVILVATNSCGSNTFTQVVNVSCPTASLVASAASTSFCEGTTSLLTATSGFDSYQWYNGTTAIAGAINNTYTANTSGSYSVIGNNGLCDYASGVIDLTMNPLPVSSFSNSASGMVVNFTETASNETSYSWNFGDGTTSTLANPSHTYGAPGSYTVILVATNSCGSNTFTQVVTIACSAITADVYTSSGSTYFCQGSSLQLLTSETYSSYQWYFNSDSISGAVDPTYTAEAAGFYSFTAMNSEGCPVTGNSINIIIRSIPALDLGADIEFCSEATIIAPAGFDSYLWSDGSTSSTILVNQSDTLLLTVSDEFGCTNTDEIIAKLDPALCTGTIGYLISANPNQANNIVFTSTSSKAYFEDVNVYDEVGRWMGQVDLPAQATSFKITLKDFADALYIVKFKYNGEEKTEKIFKRN